MGFLSDHPHTAITDEINRIVSSRKYSLDAELGPLVDLIRSPLDLGTHDDISTEHQYISNQEEAARSFRKKLKWGNELQQLRTLELLGLFIGQGLKFSVLYNDFKLIERLTVIALNQKLNGNGQHYAKEVINYARLCILNWYEYIESRNYKNKRCYESIVKLYKYVKNHKMKEIVATTSNDLTAIRLKNNFMDDSADETVFQYDDPHNMNRNKDDAKYRIPKIDLKKEDPKIQIIISDALAAAIALENSLMVLPVDANAMEDEDCTTKFVQARAIRRKVLRYLQLVTEGKFLGSLLHANDELVKALTAYDKRCQPETDDDELVYDSDDSLANYESDEEEEDDESETSATEEINSGWVVDTHPSVKDSSKGKKQNSFSREFNNNNPFSDNNQL
ncbi:hypothetical protein RI543_003522 [Arxiozyma heterogenica]|uniref:LAS seventeen-binding protein 5 n=1 Tax=Arxiozyma heterogenica TaxID=278026 RepID=A0AAN7WH55_9SACH|nr:hypothetical protein RI543_003522 [Kazachstania heterogenica]